MMLLLLFAAAAAAVDDVNAFKNIFEGMKKFVFSIKLALKRFTKQCQQLSCTGSDRIIISDSFSILFYYVSHWLL